MQTEEIWCLNCWKMNHSLVQWNESTFFVFLSPFLYVLILRHQLSINCFKTLIWIFKKCSFSLSAAKLKNMVVLNLKNLPVGFGWNYLWGWAVYVNMYKVCSTGIYIWSQQNNKKLKVKQQVALTLNIRLIFEEKHS